MSNSNPPPTNFKFKTGDIVALNSGSPFLTVRSSNEDGSVVKCVLWCHEKQRFEVETFRQDMLMSEDEVNGKQITDVSV